MRWGRLGRRIGDPGRGSEFHDRGLMGLRSSRDGLGIKGLSPSYTNIITPNAYSIPLVARHYAVHTLTYGELHLISDILVYSSKHLTDNYTLL